MSKAKQQYPCPLSPTGLCEHGGGKYYNGGYVHGISSFCRHKQGRRFLSTLGFKCPKGYEVGGTVREIPRPLMTKPPSSPYIWTPTPPSRPGHYWYMGTGDSDPEVVRVYREGTEPELTVKWGPEEDDVNYVCNEHDALWAGPVPLPRYAAPPEEGAG